ncbi:hypothetical protein HDU98_005210, partial [Podochytrium sp. JEL0797]
LTAVKFVFEVAHRNFTDAPPQYLFVLDNGASVCTCLLHVNAGLFCSHFYAVQLANPDKKLFSIDLVPRRLLSDHYQLKPPLGDYVGVAGSNSIQMWVPTASADAADVNSKMRPIMDALMTTRGAELPPSTASALRSQIEYADFMAVAKKTFEVLQSQGPGRVVEETQKMRQLNLRDVSASNVEDPPQKQGKGRPKIKRLAGAVERDGNGVSKRRRNTDDAPAKSTRSKSKRGEGKEEKATKRRKTKE